MVFFLGQGLISEGEFVKAFDDALRGARQQLEARLKSKCKAPPRCPSV
jgi:hypothetical protein